MPKGKMAAQVAHGAVDAALKSEKENSTYFGAWRQEGMKKVVLYVDDLDELIKFKNFFDQAGIVNSLIKDAGRTYFSKPTISVLGVGPDKEDKIDEISGDLKLA